MVPQLFSFLFIVNCLLTFTQANSTISEAFKKEQISPDIIKTVPSEQLKVNYGNKAVQLGNQFKLSEVAEIPKIEWLADKNSLYTLIKADPDALSRKSPIWRSYLHWLVVNIPESDLEKGQTLASYKGAGAPPKTGLHRYVFLIYKQKATIQSDFKDIAPSSEKRKSFNVQKFVDDNQLGDPLYGNFYQAQHED